MSSTPRNGLLLREDRLISGVPGQFGADGARAVILLDVGRHPRVAIEDRRGAGAQFDNLVDQGEISVQGRPTHHQPAVDPPNALAGRIGLVPGDAHIAFDGARRVLRRLAIGDDDAGSGHRGGDDDSVNEREQRDLGRDGEPHGWPLVKVRGAYGLNRSV